MPPLTLTLVLILTRYVELASLVSDATQREFAARQEEDESKIREELEAAASEREAVLKGEADTLRAMAAAHEEQMETVKRQRDVFKSLLDAKNLENNKTAHMSPDSNVTAAALPALGGGEWLPSAAQSGALPSLRARHARRNRGALSKSIQKSSH